MKSTDALNMVFMGGAPRSGTSLLQKMLGFHTDILAGPEFENMYDLVNLYKRMRATNKRGKHSAYCDFEDIKIAIENLTLDVLSKKNMDENIKLICEKTPKNVLVFNELTEIFPKAKFIFLVRDPRAIIASLKKVGERMEKGTVKSAFAQGIDSDIKLVRSYLDHGFKFYNNHKENCYLLSYEELVSNPEGKIKDLCKFLGLEFQKNMLEIDNPDLEGQRLDRTMTAWNKGEDKARKINSSGIEKWKETLSRYESDLVALNFTRHAYLKDMYDIRFEKSIQFYLQRVLKAKN